MNDVLLKVESVSKHFPGVQALDKVSLEVLRGEVHAVVGENGAGKTTLMNILSGVTERDSGRIVFGGHELEVADPRYSQQLGISTVYQELALAPNLSIMDNICMWNLPHNAIGLVDTPEMRRRTLDVMTPLGVELDPNILVKDLSVSHQQLVEIAKALAFNSSLIIMDEPNSALSPSDTELLFDVIRRLRGRGVTTLFISHRLDEVFQIADRITVLRDGEVIGTKACKETSIDEIVSMMVGRELKSRLYMRSPSENKDLSNDAILSVRNLSSGKLCQDVSFDLHRHEILGVAGLVGAGRTHMAETLFGLHPIEDGHILIDGNPVEIRHPHDAVELGVGFVPEDRKHSGLFLRMAVADNINIAGLDDVAKMGFVVRRSERDQAQQLVEDIDIRLSSIEQLVESLSGGNQQKAIVARWLAVDPKILILDEPTRGIDVGAKAQIYELINRLAEEGVAILLISSELEEIMALSDRILVMRRGRISAEFDRSEATSDELMMSAA
jgi:ABC-type sugar transport system ATPase subunit